MKTLFKLLLFLFVTSFVVSCGQNKSEKPADSEKKDSVVDMSTGGPATFLEAVTQHIYYGEFEKNLPYFILSERYKRVYNNPDSIDLLNKRYSGARKKLGGFKVVRVLDMKEDGDFLIMKTEIVFGDTVLPCLDFKMINVDGKWRIIFE